MRVGKVNRKSICVSSVASVLALGWGAVAFADTKVADSNAFQIEEIMVTAQKRVESSQQVPVAISVISESMIDGGGMTELEDIGHFTPNMTFTTGAASGMARAAVIFIRGIGQRDFSNTVEPGIGVYVDGIYFARTQGGNMDIMDIERVEVLRGPQGTLFGKNTIGGALNIVTTKPADEFEGKVRGTVGSYNRFDFDGVVHIPLADKLFTKFSFSSRDRDGHVKSLITGDDFGGTNRQSGRAAIRWVPSDTVEVNLKADYSREDTSGRTNLIEIRDPNAPLSGLWNNFVADPEPLNQPQYNSGRLTNYSTDRHYLKAEYWGMSADVSWQVSDEATLRSITGYRELKTDGTTDGDSQPANFTNTGEIQAQNQFTQEVQLVGDSLNDRLHWVGGLFYMQEDAQFLSLVRIANGLYSAAPFIGVDIELDQDRLTDGKSWAAFGQATYDLTNKLSFTGGIRYSEDKKTAAFSSFLPNQGALEQATLNDKWTFVNWRAALEYNLYDDVLLYSSASTGAKSGGFNPRPLGSLAEQFTPFDEETLTSYEAGMKSTWLDRRLQLNASAFYYDYKDIQLLFNQPLPSGGLLISIENAGTAKVKGFEIESIFMPVRGLNMTLSVAHTDWQWKNVNTPATGIPMNGEAALTPDWTFNASVDYEWQVSNAGSVTIRGDARWQDGSFLAEVNEPENYVGSFWNINARLTFTPPNQNWEVALFGTNLTDNIHKISGVYVANFGYNNYSPSRPREWGASLTAKF